MYITLRTGITGASDHIDFKALQFIKKVQQIIHLPLAAGFGLSKAAQIKQLKGKVDIAVIGSKIIDLMKDKGVLGVNEFLTQLKLQ